LAAADLCSLSDRFPPSSERRQRPVTGLVDHVDVRRHHIQKEHNDGQQTHPPMPTAFDKPSASDRHPTVGADMDDLAAAREAVPVMNLEYLNRFCTASLYHRVEVAARPKPKQQPEPRTATPRPVADRAEG
jgi:hypothetical protein